MIGYVKDRIRLSRIRDWSYYEQLNNRDVFMELARNGLFVDDLIKLGDEGVIAELIHNRYGKEHYDELKTHKSDKIRLQLARNGYYPGHFIHDDNEDIQAAVVCNHPSFAHMVMNKEGATIYNALVLAIGDELHPNIDDLNAFINMKKPHPTHAKPYVDDTSIEAFITKLKAEKLPKSDKSRYELYHDLFDVRYAQTMTVLQIDSLLYLESLIGHAHVTEAMLNQIVEADCISYINRYESVNRIVDTRSLFL